MGNSKVGCNRGPNCVRFADGDRASRNSIQPKGLAGDSHA